MSELPDETKRKISESMIGNNNAAIVKSEAEMIALFDKYCTHIANGYSKASFPDCDPRTIEKYIEENPAVLQSEKVEEAFRKNLLFWEKLGIHGTIGIDKMKRADGTEIELKSFNAAAWIFNMKNRHRWTDRQDVTTGGEAVHITTSVVLPKSFEDPDRENENLETDHDGSINNQHG